jgi:nitrite reductase (NADH) small subunit
MTNDQSPITIGSQPTTHHSSFIIHNFLIMVQEQNPDAQVADVNFWFKAAEVSAFPENGGACVKYADLQIAVFNFTRRGEWYACQNMCPHKQQMILARGLVGDQCGEPKVACPFHKKTFSLITGENLNGDKQDGECLEITTYPVKIEDGYVYIGIRE